MSQSYPTKKSLITIFDHKERILRTLTYIDTHLSESLTLKDLAGVACLSEYHFHRSFREYTGLTLSEYLRGLRLTKAADILAHADIRILDVALSVGYETGEAFTKAFGRAFGISPSGFRKQLGHTPPKYHRRFPDSFHLVPCADKDDAPEGQGKPGRKAYEELNRLGRQVQMEDVLSQWVSVFPHFCFSQSGGQPKGPFTRVRIGPMWYQVKPFFSRQSFQILAPATCGVLHEGAKPVVFKLAGEVIPDVAYQPLRHLPRLPIRLRSILLVPRQRERG
jgi:AraC-like DNA-binding protein